MLQNENKMKIEVKICANTTCQKITEFKYRRICVLFFFFAIRWLEGILESENIAR